MARISRRHPSPGKLLQEGEIVSRSVSANVEDLPHLQWSGEKLQGQLREIQALAIRASALQAEKQEVNRQLRESLDGASKLITFLQAGAREHYGASAEKLVEFGIQPFRGYKRRASKKKTEEAQEKEGAAQESSAG